MTLVIWARRHWLWIVAAGAGSLLAVLVDLWWHEWRETGRAYREPQQAAVCAMRVRCIP